MAKFRSPTQILKPEESRRRQGSLVGELFDLAERSVKKDASEAALVEEARRTGNLTEVARFDRERELQKRRGQAERRRKNVERGIRYVYLQQQRRRKLLAQMEQFSQLFTRSQLKEKLEEQHAAKKSQTLFEWIEAKIRGHEKTRRMEQSGVYLKITPGAATIGKRELEYALWAGQHRMDLIRLLEQHGWDHHAAEEHYRPFGSPGNAIQMPAPRNANAPGLQRRAA